MKIEIVRQSNWSLWCRYYHYYTSFWLQIGPWLLTVWL